MEVSSNWKKFIEVEKSNTEASVASKSCRLPLNRCPKKQNRLVRQRKSCLPKRVKRDKKPQGRLTEVIALDCEMVGIQDGKESMLARVSIVNCHGQTIYDTFVKPTEPVVDFRTSVSGVRPLDLEDGEEFHVVQKSVASILKGRTLVGHALHNDLGVLFLSHPRRRIRDTSKFGPFREVTKGKTPSLKRLAKEILGVNLQEGEHCSVQDAKATMQLYNLYKNEWESGRM